MAKILGTLSSLSTKGEIKAFNALSAIPDEDLNLLCYYEPIIGSFHPDFILLSPKIGVIIIEIKDYLPSNIVEVKKNGDWVLLSRREEEIKENIDYKDNNYKEDEDEKEGIQKQKIKELEEEINVKNPFDQLYNYWRAVNNRIQHCKFPNHIEIPIIQIALFPNIPKSSQSGKVIIENAPTKIQIWFKENISNKKNLHESLLEIIPIKIEITPKHYRVLRANLFPTSRLPRYSQKKLYEYQTDAEKVKLLDYQQEKFARELGEGHRLIFGVAGSGKTILLIARARFLAQKFPKWRILVLCYNKLLKKMIYNLIIPQDYTDITVSTFHGWAQNFIESADQSYAQIYNKGIKKALKTNNRDLFFDDFVPKILQKVIDESPNFLYDAILIDEAQDFEKEWFRLLIKVLNPKTNSLLITCDGLQGIYARKKFYWVNVGIKALGRVKKFKKSYRNPKEVGRYAIEILPENLLDLMKNDDEFLIPEEYTGIKGIVEFYLLENRQNEYQKIAEKILILLKQKSAILILFRRNLEKMHYKHPFIEELKKQNIDWINMARWDGTSPGVLITTIYSAKGLEANTVIIPEIDEYKTSDDLQLLYVGITRTIFKLIMTASRKTDIVKKILNLSNSIDY